MGELPILDIGVGGIFFLLGIREAMAWRFRRKNGRTEDWCVTLRSQGSKLDGIAQQLKNYEKYIAPSLVKGLEEIKTTIEKQNGLLSSVCTQLKLQGRK